MSCENTQAYTPKPNPYSGAVSKYTPKVSPLTAKVSPLSSTPVPLSNVCLDYVVENYEDGDFFELMNGDLLILNQEMV